MILFLISGKAGSGKNEVANLINKYYDKTVITSFSKYIKLYALELTNWDGKDSSKPRKFLQNMGDKLRAIKEDFLTKRIKEDLLVYQNEGIEYVVVSDVRLTYELEYFDDLDNIKIVKVRVNCDNCRRNLTASEKMHHTELELDNYDKFDYVIYNKFDEQLEKDVLKMLEGLK